MHVFKGSWSDIDTGQRLLSCLCASCVAVALHQANPCSRTQAITSQVCQEVYSCEILHSTICTTSCSAVNACAGITLSKSQVKRGTELAAEQGLGNCSFQVMDALHMDFPDDTFDLVWACESGEHMPDKKLYVEEMTRVLKPGASAMPKAGQVRPVTPTCRWASVLGMRKLLVSHDPCM